MNDFKSTLANGEILNQKSTNIQPNKLKSRNLKYVLIVQSDGNVVLDVRHNWKANNRVVWATHTHGKGTAPYHLKIEHRIGIQLRYHHSCCCVAGTNNLNQSMHLPFNLILTRAKLGDMRPQSQRFATSQLH